MTLLPAEERALFAREFEKEVPFLQMLFLLVNKSSPAKNIDLIWVDGGVDGGRVSLWRGTGTTQALRNPALERVRGPEWMPNQEFCDLVNDRGRLDDRTCFLCDKAAAGRVRRSGHSEVYRCHAGLTDMAVPVIASGHCIGTLHCGQFLTEPPTRTAFARIKRDLAHLQHVDFAELERAYREVPVFSNLQVEEVRRSLELCAEYVGRMWQRLRDGVRLHRSKLREAQLLRTEFAHLMLQGAAADSTRVREITRALGFRRPPNRVMVVRVQHDDAYAKPAASFDVALTAALQVMEEICERMRNVAVAHLRQYGVCVFCHETMEARAARDHLRARNLAEKVVIEVGERCSVPVRIGIGSVVSNWRQLPDSYQEACLALSNRDERIAVYAPTATRLEEMEERIERIRRHLSEFRIEDARLEIRALPASLVAQTGSAPANVAGPRSALLAALESIGLEAQRAGCTLDTLASARNRARVRLEKASTLVELEEAFFSAADEVVLEVRHLLASKREKIAERARRMVDWSLERNPAEGAVSLETIANALRVSTGHLSRIFPRAAGMPFRRFLTVRRVELAKKLLLDPLKSVSEVAAACGYSDPAYFARVFRRVTGCSPSEYVGDPGRLGIAASEPRAD